MSSQLKDFQPGDVCALRYSMTQSIYDALETATMNLDSTTQKQVHKFIRKMTANLRAKTGPRPCVLLRDRGGNHTVALMATFEGDEFDALHELYRKYCIPVYPTNRPSVDQRGSDVLVDDTPLALTPMWPSGSKSAWVFTYPISIPLSSRLSRWTKRSKWGGKTQWHVDEAELARFQLVTDATRNSFEQSAMHVPKMVVDFAVSRHLP